MNVNFVKKFNCITETFIRWEFQQKKVIKFQKIIWRKHNKVHF